AFAHACTRNYTVLEGDTCDSISAANNASTYQLAAVNPSIDAGCSNLLPGESLCLGTVDQDCKETYVVQPDDTCDIVAASQGINSTMVRFNNPQIDEECTNLYIGEVLCICDLVKVPLYQDRTSSEPSASSDSVEEDEDDDDLPECEDEDED
ncbi:hypothetical protein SCHPADRAFT_825133, partial [Schizopora paradoxa]